MRNLTKVLTTYSRVRPGDEIDSLVVIGKACAPRPGNVRLVSLAFAPELAWGPWVSGNTPVSVWR